MKILGTSIIPSTVNNKPIHNQSFRGQITQNEDSFTPQFPNDVKLSPEQSKKILSSPELMQNFATFISNGLTKAFFQLMEIANGTQKTTQETAPEQQTPAASKEQQKIEELKSEISRLQEENKSIKEKLHQTITQTPAGYIDGVNVIYPKKVGMTKEEAKLKELVTSMRLPSTEADLLTDVIFAIHSQEEKSVRNEYVTRLYLDLTDNKYDLYKLSKVIENYHKELYPQEDTLQTTNDSIEPPLENSSEQLVNANFPKRKGLMSKELLELRATIEQTKFYLEDVEKIKAICAKLSIKGTDKSLIQELNQELTVVKAEPPKTSQIIESWYKTLITDQSQNVEDNSATEIVTPQDEKNVTETETTVLDETPITEENVAKEGKNVSEEETYRTESEKQKIQLNPILGKIELDPLEEAKRQARLNKLKIKKGLETEVNPEVKTKAKSKATTKVKQEIESPYLNRNSKFYIKMSYKNKRYIKDSSTEINQVIRHFKKTVNSYKSKDHVPQMHWVTRIVLQDDITENQILSQLKTVNSAPNKRHYQHITNSNAHEFVEVINQDCFKGLFNIHSAMRLIDRFVKFDSEIPYEQQSKEIVECLKNLIHKGLDLGVNFEAYEDNTTDCLKPKEERKTYKGVAIVIPPEYFDDTEKYYFGDKPLKVYFCEIQGVESSGAISTIFSDDDYTPPTE